MDFQIKIFSKFGLGDLWNSKHLLKGSGRRFTILWLYNTNNIKLMLVLISQSKGAILSCIQPPGSPRLQFIPPLLLHWLQFSLCPLLSNRLKDGKCQERLDLLRVLQLGVTQHLVRVDVDTVGGQVAGLLPLPCMWLVIWPSGFWFTSFPNILETTRAADDIHNIDCLARDLSRNGEASLLST